MGIRVKSSADIASKWARVSAQRDGDYKDGVTDPGVEWARAAAAAEETYVQGVTEAAGRGAFGKGIAKAGDEKWRRKRSRSEPSAGARASAPRSKTSKRGSSLSVMRSSASSSRLELPAATPETSSVWPSWHVLSPKCGNGSGGTPWEKPSRSSPGASSRPARP